MSDSNGEPIRPSDTTADTEGSGSNWFQRNIPAIFGKAESPVHAAEFDLRMGCAGTDLGKFHRGYFSNPETARVFADAILAHVQSRFRARLESLGENLDISLDGASLDTIETSSLAQKVQEHLNGDAWRHKILHVDMVGIGSGPGLPEILTFRTLKENGFDVRLVLSDKVKEAIASAYEGYDEPEVSRQVWDNKNIALPDNSVDIVMARACDHYEATKEGRLRVLEEVRRVLRKGGVFFNQTHAFPNKAEADFSDFLRHRVGKMSQHVPAERVLALHRSVFPSVSLADQQPAPLYTDERDYAARFHLSLEERAKIIEEVRTKMLEWQDKLTANVRVFPDDPDEAANPNRFMQNVPFQLIRAENV